MTKQEEWIQFLKSNESLYHYMMDEGFMMLVVDSGYKIVYLKDYDSGTQSHLKFYEGTQLPHNSSSGMCIRSKRIVRRVVPKEVYGIEIRTVSIPFEDGSGCATLVFNISTAYSISAAFEQIVASTEEITASSQSAHTQAIEMEENFLGVISRVSETVKESKSLMQIYSLVKTIADNLRLISINALIEAAHAGENGRGFSVVASEVRKLADQTASQMDQVSVIIEKINQNGTLIEEEVTAFQRFIQEQSFVSTEISKAIETVAVHTQSLQSSTNRLLKLEGD